MLLRFVEIVASLIWSHSVEFKIIPESLLQEAYLKVYDWQFINCLELWTNVICTYNSDADIHHLAYPLTQIIFGVARLVPTARYLPIRLQCARMLNRIGFSTSMFLPVSALLLDVLEFKELSEPPVGPGKGVDLLTRKLVCHFQHLYFNYFIFFQNYFNFD